MKRLAVLIAALAVLLAGCRVDVVLRLDVEESGAGTLASEVTINNELRDLINSLANDSEAIFSAFNLRLDGDTVTTEGTDTTSYTTTVSFDDAEEITEVSAGNFTSFTLELADEGVAMEATLDVAGEIDFSQFPVPPSTIDPETLGGRVVVSLPGEVTDHNADEVLADGTLSWTIPIEEELYMFVNTVFDQGGFPWWVLGLVALSVGLAFIVWLAAVRREKKDTAARRPAPEPPPIDSPQPEPETAPAPPELKSKPRQHSPFFDFDD